MSAAVNTHREVANRGLLVVSVMLATLMQALDTTIANVALPNMQGTLSATQDQISWVLTSYIVAAAIATPATGWLASVMGRRRLLLIAIAGFTFASVLCGMATSIGAMVAFRLLQGLFGAALVPLSQSTLLDVYPREKHGAAMALWGMGVMVGPILGPPLGGWLTDSYSWHWVFLINVPIGALALLGVAASLPTDETRASRFDWRGFAFLAIGIGALQLFLDRGEQQDWFGSVEIQVEAALAFLGFYLYAVHWKFSARPFLDLGLFAEGQQLPSETELAMQFGVATVTLREALAYLRQRGVIETRRGRNGGSFIRAIEEIPAEIVLSRLDELSTIDLRDLCDEHIAISGTAARLAARRASREHHQHLAQYIETLGKATTRHERRRADARFHIEIAVASQSVRLTHAEIRLQAEIGELLWLPVPGAPSVETIQQEHTAIREAIVAGDPNLAGALVEAHVNRGIKRLIDMKLELLAQEAP